jgi:acyl carrier protein
MNVNESVKRFIVDNFFVADASTVSDDTSLILEGIVDSTGMLEVIGFLESTFHIAVGDTEATPDNLETIGRIAAFVARKQASGEAAS